MFLFTVTKPGLRQAGALALCAVCLCGTVAAAVHFSGGAVTASAAAVPGIETTQDIGTYFTGYGFDTDLASAAVDKVKIPKKWDDSFAAFNQIVQESGLDLADYKGKTVEKWTVLCPQLSTGDHDTYCVLLVYKAKAVGAYLLQKPSGEVTGLITAAKAGGAKKEDIFVVQLLQKVQSAFVSVSLVCPEAHIEVVRFHGSRVRGAKIAAVFLWQTGVQRVCQ